MNDSQESAAKAFDIGAVIKAARLKKGLKQEDVAKHLRIPTRQVSALEHNKKEDFPAFVYYRGALQSTCEFLDLDFNDLWRQMNPPAPASAPAPLPSAMADTPTQPPKQGDPLPENKRPPMRAPRKPISVPKMSGPLLIPALIFGGLLFAAGIFWLVGKQTSERTEVRQAPAPVVQKTETGPTPAAVPAATPPVGRGVHVLRVESRDDAWLRLRVDRQLVFEGNLPRGRPQTWEGKKSFGLRTPRESSLSVWLDDVPLDVATLEKDSFGNILIQPSSMSNKSFGSAQDTAEEKPAELPVQTNPPLIP